jgi:hypothetical protein
VRIQRADSACCCWWVGGSAVADLLCCLLLRFDCTFLLLSKEGLALLSFELLLFLDCQTLLLDRSLHRLDVQLLLRFALLSRRTELLTTSVVWLVGGGGVLFCQCFVLFSFAGDCATDFGLIACSCATVAALRENKLKICSHTRACLTVRSSIGACVQISPRVSTCRYAVWRARLRLAAAHAHLAFSAEMRAIFSLSSSSCAAVASATI